jgi:hypothetical protein
VVLSDSDKDNLEDKELIDMLSNRKPMKKRLLSPLTSGKDKMYNLKYTGLNLIPEEDEEKLKTLYNSQKKFYEREEANEIRKSIKVKSVLDEIRNGDMFKRSRDRLVESPSTNDSDIPKQNEVKVRRGNVSEVRRNSPTVKQIREELRSDRNNLTRKIDTADPLKLPAINSNRRNLTNILNEANEMKANPLIQKKLNNIFQNIEDIKKVLHQKSISRFKIASAPVGSDENLFRNKKVSINIKVKVDKFQKFPVKILK